MNITSGEKRADQPPSPEAGGGQSDRQNTRGKYADCYAWLMRR